jgi:hypothetical protein
MTRSRPHVTSRRPALGGALLALWLAASSSCAAGATGAAGSADEGSDGSDGPGSGSGQGAGDFGPSGGSGGGSGDFEECAKATEIAKLAPVTLFIAFDKSASMLDVNKWDAAQAAFVAFFGDPAADSLRVALRFWPDGGCDETSCNVAACSQPLVDVGPLSDPAHEQALVDAFASTGPFGLTPMSAALAGATKWALDYQTTKEGTETVAVVLVTDGEPTACETTIQAIAKYASDAYAQAEILTFAVGLLGSNESQINAIASAGHTTDGFFIGSGNTETALLAALEAIQKISVACSFAMPEPLDPGTPIDPQEVNVTYNSQPIKQVSGEGACGNGGWYYDDPTNPAIIEICPSTCDAIQADDKAQVEIVLGCQTQIQ